MTTPHTPTPWFQDGSAIREEASDLIVCRASDGGHLTEVLLTGDQIEANAAFIVRAVNAHDDLVKALKALTDCFDESGELCETAQDQLSVALEKADSVLAKVGGV